MEAGKRRLAGDTARAATTGEVQDLRREARALKECVADLTLENRLLKTYGPPRWQVGCVRRCSVVHKRIRRSGALALAMMEIRASWSS